MSIPLFQRLKLRYIKHWVRNPIVGGDSSKPAFNVFIYKSDDPAAPYLRLTGQTHVGFSAVRIEQGKPETAEEISFDEVLKYKMHVRRVEKGWVVKDGTISGDLHEYWSIPEYIIDYHLRWDWIKPVLMKPVALVHSIRPYPTITPQQVINFAIARHVHGTNYSGGRSFSSMSLSWALCPWQHHKREKDGLLKFTTMLELVLDSLVHDGVLAKDDRSNYRLLRIPLAYNTYAGVRMPLNWSGGRALGSGLAERDKSSHTFDRNTNGKTTINVNLFPQVTAFVAIILLLITIGQLIIHFTNT